MSSPATAYIGAEIFDGTDMHRDRALLVQDDRIIGIVSLSDIPKTARQVSLPGGTLAPGYVDLQVNGGGGVMLNDAPSVATLKTMASAHARLGATSILPTLITDTPAQVRAAVAAVEAAIAQGVPGIAGLHLEGPHLSFDRRGAHDATLIRPMSAEDETFLLQAATRLPRLKVTLAPENVSAQQMKRLSDAGILLSLGHSDASYEDCIAAAQNGVRCVTHLFNAMSQLGNRAPGLVGAALACPSLSAGLIADLIHVHPASIAAAMRAKNGPSRIFLVSDAMATAGSDIDHFYLNDRRIERRNHRLTLADNTLAGADLDLTAAVHNIVQVASVPLSQALAMATSVPAALIGMEKSIGQLRPDCRADFLHLLSGDLAAVWQSGRRL